MAVGIDEAVAAVAGAAHLAGRLVENVVVQRHAHAVVLGDRGLNADRFTEFGHGLILAGDLEDGAAVACGLDAVVAEAELLEQINAGLLEPADVVRVMDDTHAVGLGSATRGELDQIYAITAQVNEVLKEIFDQINVRLIDFKLEFGKDSEGRILLADEISPDTCRFWEKGTDRKLDKDRFRRDMSDVISAYEEIYGRLSQWVKTK